jgi:uncharacterized protein YkwD
MPFSKQFLVVFVASFALLASGSAANAASMSRSEASLLQAVNATRSSYHLAPLRIDPTLERAARAHSIEMIRQGIFTHGSFAQRLIGFGARGPAIGENLAWGVGSRATAGVIVAEWLASPAHRANLLRPGFNRVGIAAPLGRFAGYRVAKVVTADFAGR